MSAAALAGVAVRQVIPEALSGAWDIGGNGQRRGIRERRPLPSQGEKQYSDDEPPMHWGSVLPPSNTGSQGH